MPQQLNTSTSEAGRKGLERNASNELSWTQRYRGRGDHLLLDCEDDDYNNDDIFLEGGPTPVSNNQLIRY